MKKVIIVRNQTKELEKLLNQGYKIIAAHSYNRGLLVALDK